MTDHRPTPRQVATAALKAENWVNPAGAVKTVFDAFDAAGVRVDAPAQLTADDLSENVDLSMTCVGLAIGAAAAMLEGDDATDGMAAILRLWPENVPDAALTVGARAALTVGMTAGEQTDPDGNVIASKLGAIAATILESSTPEQEETPA